MRPGPPRGAGHDRGFTLLEVIVAITIAGLAVTAGYGALGSILDHRARAEGLVDEAVESGNQRRSLRTWLSGARLTIQEGGPMFSGLDGSWEGQPDDRLTFLTGAPTPIGEGEVVVKLEVDRDTATAARGLTATFAEWRGSAARTVEVNPHVTGLSIRYYSIPLGDRGWLPSWISRTLLPSGIEIALVGDSLPPLLLMPILVPVGNNR